MIPLLEVCANGLRMVMRFPKNEVDVDGLYHRRVGNSRKENSSFYESALMDCRFHYVVFRL